MTFRGSALWLCVALAAAIPVSIRFGDPVDRLVGTVRLPRALRESIPAQGHGWTSREEALTERERSILQTDDALERVYRGPAGEEVTLFVTFYGNKQRGLQRYYHEPTICYRDAGWTLVGTRFDRFTLETSAREIPTCRYLFEQGGRRLSVTTFFRIDDEFLDESPRNKPFWTFVDKLTPELSDAPGTFAQVQLVAPADDDARADAATRAFLRAFGEEVVAAIRPGVGT